MTHQSIILRVIVSLLLLAGFVDSASAARVYVSDFDNARVAVIDTVTNAVVTTIPVGSFPWRIVVNRTGTKGYVALGNGSVAFLDLTNNTVSRTVAVSVRRVDITLDIAQTRLYILDVASNAIAILDASTGALLTTIPVPPHAIQISLNHATGEMYLLYEGSPTILILDTHENTLSGTLENRADLRAINMTIGPDGQTVYLANQGQYNGFIPPGSDIVTAIDTANTNLASISLGDQPADIVVDPAAQRMFVAAVEHIFIVDTTSLAITASIPIPHAFRSIAYEPVSNRIYAADWNNIPTTENRVTVIDAVNATVLAIIPFSGRSVMIAVAPAPSGTFVAQPISTLGNLSLALLAIVLGLMGILAWRRRGAAST